MNTEPTLFGFALNRVVAFAGPYLAAGSGIVATWLTTHVHLLATFHVGTSSVAKAVAQATVFAVVTGVTYAGQHNWLKGFQKWAYGIGKDIADTPLPESYNTGVNIATRSGTTISGSRAEATQGFGDSEPPASG